MGKHRGPRMRRAAFRKRDRRPPVQEATEPAVGAKVPATLLATLAAIRFWIAIVLTGLCAGLGAMLS